MKVNNITYRIFAIFYSFWILFLSSGMVVSLHYCQDKLKNIAFYTEAESCHSSGDVCPMHKNKSCKMNGKSSTKEHSQCSNDDEDNCCHNEKKVIKPKFKYTFDKPMVIKALEFAKVDNIHLAKECNLSFGTNLKCIYINRPPPQDIDFQALFQSYIL